MTLRTVAILFCIAVGLTAYTLIYETGAAIWEGAGLVFRGLERSNVVRVEIARHATEDERAAGVDDRRIVLERRGEAEWQIVEPIRFRAFLPRVEGVLFELEEMVQVAEVESSAPDYERWAGEAGAKPSLTLRFELNSGEKHQIEIGAAHPVIEKDIFARIDGDDGDGEGGRIVVTRAKARTAFDATLGELRSKALVPVPPDTCIRLAVTAANTRGSKSMSRVGSTRDWRFDEGSPLAGHRVDRRYLGELLVDLNSWGAQRFVDPPTGDGAAAELAAKGLDKPAFELRVKHVRGDEIRLEVGSTFEEGGETYVWLRRPTDGWVFAAKDKALERARKEAEYFRTKHVFDFEGDDIEKVECRTPKAHFVVHKEKVEEAGRREIDDVDRWMVEDYGRQERYVADDILLGEAFSELHEVLIEKFLPSEGEGAAKFDPKKDVGSIEISLRGGRTHTIRFHQPAEDERDAKLGAMVTSRDDDPSRFLVVSRWPFRLHLGGYVFRDRSISLLDPSRVVELEIDSGTTKWTLAQLNNQWSFAHGRELIDDRKLDTSILNEFVQALHADRFRVHAFAPEVEPSAFAGYGIGDDDYHLRVKIPMLSGPRYSGFRTLTIGTRQKIDELTELHFARCDIIPIPFTLTTDIVRKLEKLIAHLRYVTGES